MLRPILITIFLLGFLPARSSHIVGGDISYTCLGGSTYEFTVSIYRDCLPPSQGGGNTSALLADDPAYLTIYNGTSFYSFDSVFAASSFTIPVDFTNECINNPPATCINRLQFKLIKNLPPSSQPYTMIYQRCCRNETINNIITPGTTGATYSCVIPPSNIVCNSSAVFNKYPPQIICINNPFVYDHSATDPDGDSLSYELCNAFKGADPSQPKPILIGGSIPSFGTVNYRSPFTSLIPMGGNPTLAINPKTGLITGTPNIQGRFVVNVCCSEWRNGVKINTESREFQFVVTNCSKAVIANIPQYSEEPNTYIVSCKSYKVDFVNQSSGGFRYFWDFGVIGIGTDTSSDFQPTYTYPDTGTYVVKLVVNAGSTCPDSITRLVKVYPDFKADFDYKGLLCPEAEISFFDKSTSTVNNINFWNWNFDDGGTSVLQNPTHTFANVSKNYQVTMISGNQFGCRDTAKLTLPIPDVNVFAGNDTIIVKNTPIVLNGTGAQDYTWSPPDFLSNTNTFNPVAVFSDTGKYVYYLQGITSNKCIGNDTLVITVANGPYLTVPNAFSPNGDGTNDFFKILAAGYKRLNSFKVYDRWGKQVFSTLDFRKGWDGYLNDRLCEIGTYFWIITATDMNGKSVSVKGDVTLLR